MASNPINLPNQSTQDLQNLAVLHQIYIAQTGALAKSSAGQTVPTAYTYKAPFIDEPPGRVPIDIQNGIAMPAVNVGVPVTVVSFTIPTGNDAVIDGMNCNVTTAAGFVDFSGDLIWQMQIDGRPVRGFENIQNQRGTVEFTRKIHTFTVMSGSTVSIVVFHQANGALTGNIIAGIYGYMYPRIQGQ